MPLMRRVAIAGLLVGVLASRSPEHDRKWIGYRLQSDMNAIVTNRWKRPDGQSQRKMLQAPTRTLSTIVASGTAAQRHVMTRHMVRSNTETTTPVDEVDGQTSPSLQFVTSFPQNLSGSTWICPP